MVGWWLHEALATEDQSEAPAVEELEHFDVAIVGGGYTASGRLVADGAPARRPDCHHGQGICGGGPNGETAGSCTAGGTSCRTCSSASVRTTLRLQRTW